MISKRQHIVDTYNACKIIKETSRVCGALNAAS